MRPRNRERAMVVGGAGGAALMGLFLMVVLQYRAELPGVLLLLLLVLVSGVSGWMLGYQRQGRRLRDAAYRKGYEDGKREGGITIRPNPKMRMLLGFDAASE